MYLTKFCATAIDLGLIAKTTVATVFGVMLFSAFIAEVIGIHALFGAFIAGAVIPQDSGFKEFLSEKIEDISVLLLLPIFFAFTGLRTQIGLLNVGELRSRNFCSCFREVRRQLLGCQAGWSLLARFAFSRRIDEYPRLNGINRLKHRLRFGYFAC